MYSVACYILIYVIGVCAVSSCHWSRGIAEAFVLCGVEVSQQLLVKLSWTNHLNDIVMDH